MMTLIWLALSFHKGEPVPYIKQHYGSWFTSWIPSAILDVLIITLLIVTK